MICDAPPELPASLHPDARRVLSATRARELAAHPVEMRDEGVDWVDHEGTEWHVYRCPVCGRVREGTAIPAT